MSRMSKLPRQAAKFVGGSMLSRATRLLRSGEYEAPAWLAAAASAPPPPRATRDGHGLRKRRGLKPKGGGSSEWTVESVSQRMLAETPELGARFALPRADEPEHPVAVAAAHAIELVDGGVSQSLAMRMAVERLACSFRSQEPPAIDGGVQREDVSGCVWTSDTEGGWWVRGAARADWGAFVDANGRAFSRDAATDAWVAMGNARVRNPDEHTIGELVEERTAEAEGMGLRMRKGNDGRWYKKVWMPARVAGAGEMTGLAPQFVPAFERDMWRRAPGGLLATRVDRPFRAFLREEPEARAVTERTWLEVPDAIAVGLVGGAGNEGTRRLKLAEARATDLLCAREMALQLTEIVQVLAALEAAAKESEDEVAQLAAVAAACGGCGEDTDLARARWALERVAAAIGHESALDGVRANAAHGFCVVEDAAEHAAEVLGVAAAAISSSLGPMREAAAHGVVSAAMELLDGASAGGATAEGSVLKSLSAIATATGDEEAAWAALVDIAGRSEAAAESDVSAGLDSTDMSEVRRAAAKALVPVVSGLGREQIAYNAISATIAAGSDGDAAWAELVTLAERTGGASSVAAARRSGGSLSVRKAAAAALLSAAQRSHGLDELRAALADPGAEDMSAKLGAATQRLGMWAGRGLDPESDAAKEGKLANALLRVGAGPSADGRDVFGVGDALLDEAATELDAAAAAMGLEGSYTEGLFLEALEQMEVRVGGPTGVLCSDREVGWPLVGPDPLALPSDGDATSGGTHTARALRECQRLWDAGVRDPAFLDLFDHLKARASLAPEAADLPASERGTDEYERLVEEFVVPVWREHAPGTTASDLGDWKRPPPEDSEADDGRLVEPAKVVNLPRALAVRPRMRLEPVSGYDIAPAGPGGLRFGRPDPREIHGQLMGPYTVEDSAGEDVVDKISPSARLAAKLRAADARKHALRSNELFQQDGAPKRLLEVTAAHRAVEIAEAGGLRRRLRAQRFRKWLDRTGHAQRGALPFAAGGAM